MTFDLPPGYAVIEAPDGDTLKLAMQLARQGSEEGTLVYAPFADNRSSDTTTSQSAIDAEHVDAGHVEVDNSRLDFSLIMEPEFDQIRSHELQVVAVISLGQAIASMVSPMVTLRYGWPADIRLNDHSTGHCSVTLNPDSEHDPTQPPGWAVVHVSAFVTTPTPPGYTSINAHCESPTTARTILETFGRNFLLLVNRWAQDGFTVISKPWRQHFDFHENELIKLKTIDGDVDGIIESINDDGSLTLQQNGVSRLLTLSDAMATESTQFNEKLSK